MFDDRARSPRGLAARIAGWFGRGRPPAGAFERGLAALAHGRYGEALAELDVALREAGTDGAAAIVSSKRGVALVGLGRRDDALAAFSDALERDERCASALVNLGNLLLEEGHALDALDYYDAALRADRDYAPAHHHRGIALRRIGRRAEAVRALRAAVRLEGRRSLGRS